MSDSKQPRCPYYLGEGKASESPGSFPCDRRSARSVADLLGLRRNRATQSGRLARFAGHHRLATAGRFDLTRIAPQPARPSRLRDLASGRQRGIYAGR
jgi:hypothetical protein